MPAKNMPGRKAGEDHARSQGCLRQEAVLKPVCWRRPVRLRLASLAFGEASSDYVGQTKTVEKERCGEVRYAHERREREKIRRKPLRSTVNSPPSSESECGGEDFAGSQGCLRQEAVLEPVCCAGQSGSAWPVSPLARPVTASSGEKNRKKTKLIWRGQFRFAG